MKLETSVATSNFLPRYFKHCATSVAKSEPLTAALHQNQHNYKFRGPRFFPVQPIFAAETVPHCNHELHKEIMTKGLRDDGIFSPAS